tara:strand:+ start:9902 stop:10999 length:1098 start_codon:yes stop_codon:yes gene_type:complete
MPKSSKNIYIGTMSGTSADSIEAVAVCFKNNQVELLGLRSRRIKPQIQTIINQLASNQKIEMSLYGKINRMIASEFGECVNDLIKKMNIKSPEIRGIGFSGQTVWHHPLGKFPFSIQLGEPNFLAEKTQIPVVSNFRNSHIALGGEGAPLVTDFHSFLFRKKQPAIIINVGGISNFSFISKQRVLGSDLGPGNALMDAYCQRFLKINFDRKGKLAASGKVDKRSINIMGRDKFFKLKHPKSTGKELFNLSFIPKSLIKKSPEDILATLSYFTALTISIGIKDYQFGLKQAYICGGGAYNDFLVKQIKELSGLDIHSTTHIGFDPKSIEAMAFAWLAKMRLEKKTLPVRSKKNVTSGLLGSITQIR